jgi:hypothetical protein
MADVHINLAQIAARAGAADVYCRLGVSYLSHALGRPQPGSLATSGGDRKTVILRDRPCLLFGPYEEEVAQAELQIFRGDWWQPQGGCMTHRLHETLSDEDFRNLARLISACTLGLWAFAAGLVIGTFLFS